MSRSFIEWAGGGGRTGDQSLGGGSPRGGARGAARGTTEVPGVIVDRR